MFKLINFPIQLNGNTYEQTIQLFNQLQPYKDKIIRTWIYVKDIDTNYKEMNRARSDSFKEWKIKNFYASTGVGGWNMKENEFVKIKALILTKDLLYKYPIYSFSLLRPELYGSTFERGVVVSPEEDKIYCIISGTASIDPDGNIVGKNLKEQLNRTHENIMSLFNDNFMAPRDKPLTIKHSIAYVRNSGDINMVRNFIKDKIPGSLDIYHSHICRPGWLVEIECVATNDESLNVDCFKVKC